MAGKSSGGSTSFENMSHEQMLAWLDQANASEVQAAADRLMAAAKEIRKIAEELKVRPQWVAWKGEGAEAFRAWANELANSTYRLSDFSEDAAKWLGQASNAIATAQASIPRDTKGAEANLAAATAARNDPDAAAIRAKSASELAALEESREKVRQEAAAQMRKLGQTYKLSATQLNNLERPKFPPPPGEWKFIPTERSTDLAHTQGGSSSRAVGGNADAGSVAIGRAEHGSHASPMSVGPSEKAEPRAMPPTTHATASGPSRSSVIDPAARVNIDSVTVPTEVPQPLAGPTGGGPITGRPGEAGGGLPPVSGTAPQFPAGTGRAPSAFGAPGKSAIGGRMTGRASAVSGDSGPVVQRPGQAPVGPVPGHGSVGAGSVGGRNVPSSGATPGRALPAQGLPPGYGVPPGSGITGGRPAGTSATGRLEGRVPGGSLGTGPVGGRASVGSGAAPGTGGRSPARQAGPITGGHMPPARGGVVGGTPQPTGRAWARPGASVPSAPTRGGISGGVPSEAGIRNGRRGAPGASTAADRQRRQKRQADRRGEPPAAG
ncbi:hypothetical protein GCM10009564_25360 [Streptomyces thermogriseus]|uniref:Translation initiation factor IF-2 n=1 Tax=Streptomyces thermogriseus TaxID=75292 RepID=A0ABN1SYM0_9ACTN